MYHFAMAMQRVDRQNAVVSLNLDKTPLCRIFIMAISSVPGGLLPWPYFCPRHGVWWNSAPRGWQAVHGPGGRADCVWSEVSMRW